ncbi:MAG: aminoacyl-tRNA hydrolase [bacterium]|nr:aminoacyl-tRNA hydrolase [bacterium]
MRLVVGLQNPESVYAGTRHNIGAEVITLLEQRFQTRLKRGPRRIRCRVGTATIRDRKVLLALPKTSMNLSGPPVRGLLEYHRIKPEDLLVIHDDIDLPFGRMRLRFGQGHGGHNGVRSIVNSLGATNFWRLKLGLGRPPGRMDPARFVLSPFARQELSEVRRLIEDAAEVVGLFLTDPERATEQAGRRRPLEGV